MPSDAASDPKVEIAHVLTMDVVEYSTLLITEQTRLMGDLSRIVKEAPRFRRAEAAGKLIRVPTGDGMLLVFFDDPQAPIECATEIASAIRSHPEIRLRMGIHSGPVNEVVDVNERTNVAGAGVDMAQRVMDCGDAGHILLSKHVADDLTPFPRWHPHLHELGECEVKHGRIISLVNFFTGEIGNAARPTKCSARREVAGVGVQPDRSRRKLVLVAAASLIALTAVVLGLLRLKGWGPAGAAQSPNRTIAVLPFENASGDPNAEYLSEGISEALINSLTELQELRVIARATAFHYKGKGVDPKRVGRELNVATVLTGKIRQMEDALTVQVDLVDAKTGAQLWGEGYERRMADLAGVKQAIAREVAQKLKLKLSGEQERQLTQRDSTNPEAYQAYLRGRYFWNKRSADGIKQAIGQFEEAIARDPRFALGHVGVADSYLLLEQYAGVPSRDSLPKARAAVDRALELDASLPEAHTSSAMIHQFMWQWARADEGFRHAISLNPNYATAHHWFALSLIMRGRLDDSFREIKRAQELDPLSPIIGAVVAIVLVHRNEMGAAIEQCQKLIELYPNHQAGYDWLGLAYLRQGRIAEAVAMREKVVEISPKSTAQAALLGHHYAISNRRPEAEAILKEVENRYAQREAVGQSPATVCIGLGDYDQAFAWLEKDFAEHSAELQFIVLRLQFDPIRRDPRYVDLIRRMGLSQ